MQVRKQQLEMDMEQQAGSKLGKEYVKAVYCHPAYLTYMQSISCKILGWMKQKMESKLLGEISITSDIQMMPPLWKKAKKMQQLKPDMEQWTASKWKGVYQGCLLSPCLFDLHAEYIVQNPRLDEAQAGIKIAKRNINNLRCCR